MESVSLYTYFWYYFISFSWLKEKIYCLWVPWLVTQSNIMHLISEFQIRNIICVVTDVIKSKDNISLLRGNLNEWNLLLKKYTCSTNLFYIVQRVFDIFRPSQLFYPTVTKMNTIARLLLHDSKCLNSHSCLAKKGRSEPCLPTIWFHWGRPLDVKLCRTDLPHCRWTQPSGRCLGCDHCKG